MKTYFVDTPEALADICQQLSEEIFFVIDTEFMREKTYYPRLALIQVGTDSITACIDPLAINDLSPLKTLFANQNVTKVFHAAGQDLELFYHLFGELPQPLYDTQIAATLQGLGEQVGYAALVKALLDVDLDKSHSRTDWLHRPLSQKQIKYAEDDVRYLAQLYPIQVEQLSSQGRLQWLEADFESLGDPVRYRPAPETSWRKVKGISRLRPAQLAILEGLAAWREQQAMQNDLPRRRVISDELLLDMARIQPKSMDELEKLRGISSGLVQKQGQTLLELIELGRRRPKEEWPQLPKKQRLTANQESQVDALVTIIKLCCADYKLSANSLATRKELEALVAGERNLPILQGWRRQHGGEQLLEFLAGNSCLTIEKNRLALKSGD